MLPAFFVVFRLVFLAALRPLFFVAII
jgi:hypothetical protein